MSIQIIVVMILTFIIYVIGTLAYSVRVVGVKTGRIAIAYSVFNVLVLVQRTANAFQMPILAKTVDSAIKLRKSNVPLNLLFDLRWVILTTTFATIVGAILIPTFIKVFGKAVQSFSIYRSIPKLMIHGFSKSGIEQFKKSMSKPKKGSISQLKSLKRIPKKIILLNVIATSISVVGGFSALYAGYLCPDLRTTCTTLSSVINGISTILIYVFIDPYLSMMTDDVIRGDCSILDFNRYIIFIVFSMIVGTVLAQAVLVPAAYIILNVAKII